MDEPEDVNAVPEPTTHERIEARFVAFRHPLAAKQVEGLFHPSEREQFPEVFKVMSDGFLSQPKVQLALKVALIEAVLSVLKPEPEA